ncbi:ADP-ribosyltransferase [Streptococcus periodonticum]|uniref:ADP ribosyltransferase domain-containing protein n=1 Tax=Streptococcus periodonticum TaxID=2490633 RepID=A0A3Q9F351_9STRE|nr:ADP-ribosyltransferase [Streptococcus periodonticum]AZQ41980.1 hypothetical protein EHW89_05715 [Streptococcus periodonticum]
MNYINFVNNKKDEISPYRISTSNNNEKYFEALERYCGSRHDRINEYLRTNNIKNGDKNILCQTINSIKCLDEIINEAPQEEYKVLYRVIDKEFYKKLMSSSSFKERGYLSTSKMERWAKDKADQEDKVVIKLYVEKDVKRIDISQINYGTLSGRTEYEVLLQRGTILKRDSSSDDTFIVSLPNQCLFLKKFWGKGG